MAGMKVSAKRAFGAGDVRAFDAVAEISGEAPTHGQTVVPPLLVASMLHTLMTNDLPIKNATIRGQMLTFVRPVYVGETVTAEVEIVTVREDRKVAHMRTTLSTAHGTCIDGEAVVSYGRPPKAHA